MKDTTELGVGQLLHILKKKAKYIVLVTLVFALVGFLIAEVFTEPVYEAQAKMIVKRLQILQTKCLRIMM